MTDAKQTILENKRNNKRRMFPIHLYKYQLFVYEKQTVKQFNLCQEMLGLTPSLSP